MGLGMPVLKYSCITVTVGHLLDSRLRLVEGGAVKELPHALGCMLATGQQG